MANTNWTIDRDGLSLQITVDQNYNQSEALKLKACFKQKGKAPVDFAHFRGISK